MAKNIKVVLNSSGVKDLLKSKEIQSVLEQQANRIAGKAGGGTELYIAETRAVVEVSGDNWNNSLLKAVGK